MSNFMDITTPTSCCTCVHASFSRQFLKDDTLHYETPSPNTFEILSFEAHCVMKLELLYVFCGIDIIWNMLLGVIVCCFEIDIIWNMTVM